MNVYYILMKRGFSNESEIIAAKQEDEKKLQAWLNENFGDNPNSRWNRISRKEAEKWEKYYYEFDDYKDIGVKTTFDLATDKDPFACRCYWKPQNQY